MLNATHFMVDEFQDADEIQYQYMMEHYRTGNIIVTAVGDDDQCIYGFRESLGVEGMNRFETESGATRITLGTNYRCYREILSSADRLISYNLKRLDKRLHAAKGKGGTVEVFRYPSADLEAEALTSKILETCKGIPFPAGAGKTFDVWVGKGQWAVLARNNFQLDAVDASFRANAIPYHKAGKSFWEKPPVSFLVTMLQSLLTDQRAGIDNLLHWAGISPSVLDELHEKVKGDYSNLFKKDFVDSLKLTDITNGAKPSDVAIFKGFITQLHGWAKGARKKDDDRINTAIHGLGVWMKEHANTFQSVRIEMAINMLQRLNGPLKDRLERVTRKPTVDIDGGVRLYTMHSSKGLEFDNVWIIGAEEGVIPSNGNGPLTQDFIDEERRLMYVAITRARNALYISSTAENPPSRFIAEATLIAQS